METVNTTLLSCSTVVHTVSSTDVPYIWMLSAHLSTPLPLQLRLFLTVQVFSVLAILLVLLLLRHNNYRNI